MKHTLRYAVVAVLVALLAIPAHADAPKPTLAGTLSLGAGTDGLRLSGDRETSLGVEMKLRLANAIGPVSLNAACRHFLEDNNPFWKSKSKLNFGFDVPVGKNALIFGDFERKYFGGDSWSWMGVRLKFGG